jgi:CRISPR-associated protein Cas2
MAKEKIPKISFAKAMARIKKAGLETSATDKLEKIELDEIENLDQRIEKVLHFVKTQKHIPENMIFMLMYDIENTKIRTNIAKFLIREGCIRIQKSVYLANLPRKKYQEIHQTLKEVQELYENNDSILFLQVPTDALNAMKIIGQQIEFDFITDNKNTLFF